MPRARTRGNSRNDGNEAEPVQDEEKRSQEEDEVSELASQLAGQDQREGNTVIRPGQSDTPAVPVNVAGMSLRPRPAPPRNTLGSCSVCLEEFSGPRGVVQGAFRRPAPRCVNISRSCAHRFHRRCITPWLVRRQNCPYCRGKIDLLYSESGGRRTTINNEFRGRRFIRT